MLFACSLLFVLESDHRFFPADSVVLAPFAALCLRVAEVFVFYIDHGELVARFVALAAVLIYHQPTNFN
jgi:hypothetical protein